MNFNIKTVRFKIKHMRINLKNKKSPALVLSGGGVKAAAFHIGVCLALSEKGFKFHNSKQSDLASIQKQFQIYVGSSAGSIISAILAAGYSVQDLIDAFILGTKKKKFFKKAEGLQPLTFWDIYSLNGPGILKAIPTSLRKQWMIVGGLEAFLKSGLKLNGFFSAQGIEKYIRNNVLKTNDFHQLNTKLFVVASELNHSRKVIFGPFKENLISEKYKYSSDCNISDAVAASTSLPPVFAPYEITHKDGNKEYYFDGEIRDTLSTHVAADNGADLVIASYSIQPYNFHESIGSLHNYGIPVILNQALYLVIQQKIEKHIYHQENLKSVVSSIEGYFKQAGLPDEHRNKMIEIIERNLQFKRDVDYIYIHPDPRDYEMFFADHFSFKKDTLEKIVKIGFKSAIRELRKYNI